MVKAYAAAAPYPFANIVAQEIFDAKLVPSDTDFKILRDFGNIPGRGSFINSKYHFRDNSLCRF